MLDLLGARFAGEIKYIVITIIKYKALSK